MEIATLPREAVWPMLIVALGLWATAAFAVIAAIKIPGLNAENAPLMRSVWWAWVGLGLVAGVAIVMLPVLLTQTIPPIGLIIWLLAGVWAPVLVIVQVLTREPL